MHCMMLTLLITNLMFLMSNHPMSMGLTLIIQTLMISMITGIQVKTFWMSYILMITMLSGMMVLFIYMSSVASNEKFKNSTKMWMITVSSILLVSMLLFFLNKMIIKNNYFGIGMGVSKLWEIHFLNKLFLTNNCMMTIMLVMYLLFTMIVSSFLVNISEGPMRMKT